MEDFAYLFTDSAASWLQGRGDTRFRRYEQYYRTSRAAAPNAEVFNLELSNEQYAKHCQRSPRSVVSVLDSKRFKHVVLFLALLWGGSLFLQTVGRHEPAATGVIFSGLFVMLRFKARREKSRRS